MSKIRVEHSHGLIPSHARERLKPLIRSLADSYGIETKWSTDAEANLARTGANGRIVLSDCNVIVELSLSYAMSPLRGTIERHIKDWLTQHLAKCRECGDTGIIETGNNDIPCECPAGDTAVLFNAVGGIQQTGKEVRAEFAANAGERKRVVDELIHKSAIRELTAHIAKCPIGWHGGRVIWHRDRTEADIIAWLQKLDALSEQAGR